MNTKIIIFSILFFLFSSHIFGQKIIGFWEIKEVKVGTQIMTPAAKWTKINKDGTYQSGNGWLQNGEGTWAFDKDKSLYSASEVNGLIDEFGPFTVEFVEDGMNWLREEDGMIVTVSLQKITELPKGTSDKIVGLWNLTSMIKDKKEETILEGSDENETIFIRWDRIYVSRSKSGRNTGYWHMHGHKPEVTLLPHEKDKKPESWLVEVSDDSLMLTGVSETNKKVVLSYKRLHQFPK